MDSVRVAPAKAENAVLDEAMKELEHGVQLEDRIEPPEADDRLDPNAVEEGTGRKYPTKVARKRAKQIVVNKVEPDLTVPEIGANVRTIPGIISQRGCTYAGCKGVVLGPTRDIVNITHGPIGCGFYSWLTRRNQTKPPTAEDANLHALLLFHGHAGRGDRIRRRKEAKAAIQEAYDIFKPKAIGIFSTCPVGLIGDDIHTVAREMKEKLGINVFGFSCEGYKGVSQSAGHHIANNGIFKHIVGLDDTVPKEGKFKINLLGEYNIGGDAFEIDRRARRCGITLVATFSGNSDYDQFANAHTADLNPIMCHRSINYVAEMMEKKFGIPWIKVNFIGAESSAKSLRKIAKYFENEELTAKVEEVIAEEMAAVEKVQDEIRPRCQGKLAMLFVGGSRAHHYQELFRGDRHEDDCRRLRIRPQGRLRGPPGAARHQDGCRQPQHRGTARAMRTRRDTGRAKREQDVASLPPRGITFREYEGMMAEMDKRRPWS